MSRIGKKPIDILDGVEVKVNNQELTIKGKLGQLTVNVHQDVAISQEDKQLVLTIKDIEDKKSRALWGLSRTLVNNAILGVTEGYSKELEINGVGFKAAVQGKKLVLNVGFSHPVEYAFPDDIKIEAEKNNIKISGIDKQKVGQIAAEIRAVKKPEPYKGKGIKYIDEHIRRKAGKVVKAA